LRVNCSYEDAKSRNARVSIPVRLRYRKRYDQDEYKKKRAGFLPSWKGAGTSDHHHLIRGGGNEKKAQKNQSDQRLKRPGWLNSYRFPSRKKGCQKKKKNKKVQIAHKNKEKKKEDIGGIAVRVKTALREAMSGGIAVPPYSKVRGGVNREDVYW